MSTFCRISLKGVCHLINSMSSSIPGIWIAAGGILESELRKDGRVALWIYAPGYLEDGPSLDNMRDLTGFKFAMGNQPWGPLLHIVDFTHPITAGLPQDTSWGTNNKLSPIFYLDDPEARVLGQVVYSQGDCNPGMGVKPSPSGLPSTWPLPICLHRCCAGLQGSPGCICTTVMATSCMRPGSLLAVHTVAGETNLSPSATGRGSLRPL